jgi:hypothetical protein
MRIITLSFQPPAYGCEVIHMKELCKFCKATQMTGNIMRTICVSPLYRIKNEAIGGCIPAGRL